MIWFNNKKGEKVFVRALYETKLINTVIIEVDTISNVKYFILF